MDDLKKDFIKEVEAASGLRFAVEVFADMVRAMAIAIESPLTFGERRKQLEAEYEQIRGRYAADEFTHFPRAFAIVCAALEAKREDFLGHALGYAAIVQHMDALAQTRYTPDRYTPGYFLASMPMRRAA